MRQVRKALGWIRDFVPVYSPIFRDEEDFQWVLGILLQEREPDRVVKALKQFMGPRTDFIFLLLLVYAALLLRQERNHSYSRFGSFWSIR